MPVCFFFLRHDRIRDTAGLFWGVVYYLLLSIEMVYAKRVVADVKLTTYGRVLYTNLLASVPCGVWQGGAWSPVVMTGAGDVPDPVLIGGGCA
jgi:hypothetical protein